MEPVIEAYVRFCISKKIKCDLKSLETQLIVLTKNEKDYDVFVETASYYYRVPSDLIESLYDFLNKKRLLAEIKKD